MPIYNNVFLMILLTSEILLSNIEAQAAKVYPCDLIEGKYEYDVKQVKHQMSNMLPFLQSHPNFQEAIIISLEILEKNYDYPTIKGVRDELNLYERPPAIDGFYKEFKEQIKSARQRVKEWKTYPNSYNKDNASCKNFYKGCLLGYGCTTKQEN